MDRRARRRDHRHSRRLDGKRGPRCLARGNKRWAAARARHRLGRARVVQLTAAGRAVHSARRRCRDDRDRTLKFRGFAGDWRDFARLAPVPVSRLLRPFSGRYGRRRRSSAFSCRRMRFATPGAYWRRRSGWPARRSACAGHARPARRGRLPGPVGRAVDRRGRSLDLDLALVSIMALVVTDLKPGDCRAAAMTTQRRPEEACVEHPPDGARAGARSPRRVADRGRRRALAGASGPPRTALRRRLPER
jgi:hypothetical protein